MVDSVRAFPQVAIIVLTWNQKDLTLDCLASLAKMDYPQDRLGIIVVDNGSNDGTAQAILDAYPQVTVLVNADNLGFAEGNNVGIRYALGGPADYIMLLNNDTVVDPSILRDLVAVAETDGRIGMVGPKMLYYDHPSTIWCAGNSINWRTGATIRLDAEMTDSAAVDDEPREVNFITACAVCVRRKLIEQIGLLDSRFFIYYEETDWCVRATKQGWRILYIPQARLWHKVSAAMGTTSPSTEYYMNRNVMLFLGKHLRGWPRLTALGRASLRSLLAAGAYTFKPHGGHRLARRDARVCALRDAIRQRWGRMGKDMERVCQRG